MLVSLLILGKAFLSFSRHILLFLVFRKKTADLRTTYVHDKAQIETNIGFDAAKPTLNGSVVFGHQGWLLGYQYVYSTEKAALTRNNFSLGYKAKDLTLVGNL